MKQHVADIPASWPYKRLSPARKAHRIIKHFVFIRPKKLEEHELRKDPTRVSMCTFPILFAPHYVTLFIPLSDAEYAKVQYACRLPVWVSSTHYSGCQMFLGHSCMHYTKNSNGEIRTSNMCNLNTHYIQGAQKVFVHLMITVQKTGKYTVPCCTEHGSACQ